MNTVAPFPPAATTADPLNVFRETLSALGSDPAARAAALHRDTIGEGARIVTPFGEKVLRYVDYVASGRALRPVESFVMEHVLPHYANTHTEASHCGAAMSRMRAAARAAVARHLDADDETAVIFAGSGATAGINRLVGLLDVAATVRGEGDVVVICGPYEHHSNILPWRESGARIVRIEEGADGGPDLGALDAALAAHRDADLLIGTFSAVSNVTGIVTDVAGVTRRLKRAGALALWDWAAGAPYCEMSMRPAPDAEIDAIVYSSHKFPGGPGASGILAIRRDAVRVARPTSPGGGTVTFVSPWAHDYSDRIETREEGGTPNVVGDIRAGLCVLVKEALGAEYIATRNAALGRIADAALAGCDRLDMLGHAGAPRLPIRSFAVRDGTGRRVHHQLFTRMLSDLHGIQARGGCACAGPYAHDLLGIGAAASEGLRVAIAAGDEGDKPGWVRMNLSYLLDDAEACAIVNTIRDTAETIEAHRDAYAHDAATARFRAIDATG